MRKTKAKKIPPAPDAKYNDALVTRFVNNLMWQGKKNTAFNIFYSIDQSAALNMIRARLGEVNLIMLRSMIECINEDIAILEGNDDLLVTVKAIGKRTDALGRDELEKISETVEEFKDLFGRYLS